ncbi:baseplate distal hub subunit [Yersinia phage JC221]|nr:baseplate distal hub subunit [Yersinia phage JC221]
MKNNLDKFMVTRLDIQNKKNKIVYLPTGEKVTIPKLSYRHFVKLKTLKTPVEIMNYIVDEIKPRDLTTAETEFLLIHLHYHNNEKATKKLAELGVDLNDMKISEAKYDYTFDNIQMTFKPVMFRDNIFELLHSAKVDGEEIELTDDKRLELINSLYRHEYDEVKRGVLQEVYIMHKGKTVKGLNIIVGE